MAGLPDELEFELEALRATYDEVQVAVEFVDTSNGSCTTDHTGSVAAAEAAAAAAVVTVPVAPRGCSPEQQFVAARLQLRVPPSYPAEAPGVVLTDARGLGDVRLAHLQATLAAEAAALAGDCSLGHLVETALDLLSGSNRPEGLCAFCLEPLPAPVDHEAAGRGERPTLLRLQCFHCFHFACFAPWWQWQQQRLAAREAQLAQEYRSMAALKLAEEGIRREAAPAGHGAGAGAGCAAGNAGTVGDGEADGAAAPGAAEAAPAYVVYCPACRAEVPPSSLAFAWGPLQAASAASWSSSGGAHQGAAQQALSTQQRDALAAMQQRHAAVRERQAACGGLVEATHSVSLSDLQQAAAAAAVAAAAAEAAAVAMAATQAAEGQLHEGVGGRGSGGRGGSRRGRAVDGRGSAGRHVGGGRGRGRARGGQGGTLTTSAGAVAAVETAMDGLQLQRDEQQKRQQPAAACAEQPSQLQRQQQPRGRQQPQRPCADGSGGGRAGNRGGHNGSGRGRGRGRGQGPPQPPSARQQPAAGSC